MTPSTASQTPSQSELAELALRSTRALNLRQHYAKNRWHFQNEAIRQLFVLNGVGITGCLTYLASDRPFSEETTVSLGCFLIGLILIMIYLGRMYSYMRHWEVEADKKIKDGFSEDEARIFENDRSYVPRADFFSWGSAALAVIGILILGLAHLKLCWCLDILIIVPLIAGFLYWAGFHKSQ